MKQWSNNTEVVFLIPIQDGPLLDWSRMEGQKGPLAKIFHTFLSVMKLGTTVSYLEKTQKTYKSRDTPLEFL